MWQWKFDLYPVPSPSLSPSHHHHAASTGTHHRRICCQRPPPAPPAPSIRRHPCFSWCRVGFDARMKSTAVPVRCHPWRRHLQGTARPSRTASGARRLLPLPPRSRPWPAFRNEALTLHQLLNECKKEANLWRSPLKPANRPTADHWCVVFDSAMQTQL